MIAWILAGVGDLVFSVMFLTISILVNDWRAHSHYGHPSSKEILCPKMSKLECSSPYYVYFHGTLAGTFPGVAERLMVNFVYLFWSIPSGLGDAVILIGSCFAGVVNGHRLVASVVLLAMLSMPSDVRAKIIRLPSPVVLLLRREPWGFWFPPSIMFDSSWRINCSLSVG